MKKFRLVTGVHFIFIQDNKEDKIPDVSLISGQLRSMYPQQGKNLPTLSEILGNHISIPCNHR